jgi:hypothetical protein
MFVLLYIPQDADPEVFGTYPTPLAALNIFRKISTAAGRWVLPDRRCILSAVSIRGPSILRNHP